MNVKNRSAFLEFINKIYQRSADQTFALASSLEPSGGGNLGPRGGNGGLGGGGDMGGGGLGRRIGGLGIGPGLPGGLTRGRFRI